jgi:hypothetical protein
MRAAMFEICWQAVGSRACLRNKRRGDSSPQSVKARHHYRDAPPRKPAKVEG